MGISALTLKIYVQKSGKMFIRNPQNHSIFNLRFKVPIMDSTLKARLKGQIQAYMEKKPTADLREVRNWLETDNSLLEGIQYNPKTMKSFIFYQLRKFKSGSDVRKHLGGNGRPSISKRKKNQILRLSLKKENSLRGAGLSFKVGVRNSDNFIFLVT